MSITLHSRVARIGGPELAPGCGYRDIVIHEMTEGEIRNLKTGCWLFPLVSAMTTAIWITTTPAPIQFLFK